MQINFQDITLIYSQKLCCCCLCFCFCFCFLIEIRKKYLIIFLNEKKDFITNNIFGSFETLKEKVILLLLFLIYLYKNNSLNTIFITSKWYYNQT